MSETAEVESIYAAALERAAAAHTSSEPSMVFEPNESYGAHEEEGFDEAFQTKVAALLLRDATFLARTEGLISSKHFDDVAHSIVVGLVLEHYSYYRQHPDMATFVTIFKKAVAEKRIPEDLRPAITETVKKLYQKTDISNRDFVIDQVAQFAKAQALAQAVLKVADLVDKRKFKDVAKIMQDALDVGANDDIAAYDFWEEINARSKQRAAELAGVTVVKGISTGFRQIDELLYRKGWGRKELSMYMGAAKSGKTTALINSAIGASLAGFNVMYVSLEVACDVIAARSDANISGKTMRELVQEFEKVESAISGTAARAGRFVMHEFPARQFKPADLRRLVNRHRQKGIVFDLVIVDYADLMAPDHRSDDAHENTTEIYTSLRAIAQEENIAVLTATQANREGAKAGVIKDIHVADDYEKIRICDVVISINYTDEERARGECRLFFAAQRNQEGGFAVRVKQDLARMKFITSVLGIEPA
ncbi:DnaB-like helicase C-terminal domain-containing protein [Chitinibacter tainanensis]|uniref:DnaB-like helicase C-terminal domain-containing protein n=1 Tax=Chitinibacter tainanensis TaxID=230667 RepID=UPI00042A3B3B|nr:DnaB-like helicase C-terminal domain-containing protein [Chitinibacter tainanensis]